jgi:uncharacterized protein (DUF1800 family)
MLPQATAPWTIFEAAHLLNRAGFSGSPDEIKAFYALGRHAAVNSLLLPIEPIDAFPPPAWSIDVQAIADLQARVALYKGMLNNNQNLTPEQADQEKRQKRKEMRKVDHQRISEAQAWWFHRMLVTRAPLREKMTLFWHDHFATSLQKVKQPYFLMKQNELFRRNAFGSFKTLTQDILLDPAMVLYLDTGSSKKGKPNENFAREVMELFTLGEGNYTEQDVHEAARAFTGYQLNRKTGTVTHNKRNWDETNKTFFGKTGPFDGKDIINLIFTKKEAARLMTRKLWEFYVYDKPSDGTINALSDNFQKNDFNIKPLLREIFLSKEFYSEKSIRSEIKCPIQYTIALLKQLEIANPPRGFPITAEAQLGQVLFMPPNVAGWDWGQAWINTNTLLTRYNLAGFITKGSGASQNMMGNSRIKIPGMAAGPKMMGSHWNGPDYAKITPLPIRSTSKELVDSLIFRFFQDPVPTKARASFIQYADEKKGPISTDSEVAELCHLMLSTPYYQLT